MHDTLSPEALSYLERLRTALSGLPDEDEIVAGVTEELRGLDDAAARERILILGDPTFIAAAARGAATTDTVHERDALSTSPERATTDLSAIPESARATSANLTAGTKTAWILVPTLTMIIGVALLPFIGPLVGTVLLWLSPAFRWRAKLWGTLAPLAAGLAVFAFGALAPAPESSAVNPLVPSPLHQAPFVWGIAVAVAGALLLIVRLRQPR